MSTPTSDPTVTSYAILGLLAIRSWTTYELAQQMRRSMRYFWPRAESRIYEEPKRLVALGLARASVEHTGRRPRTRYAITAKGRRALAAWLAEPGAGPQLEFEGLLKLLFADHGTREGAQAAVDAIKQWAERLNAENIGFAREIRDTGGPFPNRVAQIVVAGRFMTEFADMVAAWADWADSVISEWPEDPSCAEPDWSTVGSIAARSLPDDRDARATRTGPRAPVRSRR